MNARVCSALLVVALLATSAAAQRAPDEEHAPSTVIEQETFRVEVRFATLDVDKRAVGGIALDVGVGLMRSWAASPFTSGDRANGIVRPTLAHAVSDERGIATLGVDVPVEWKGMEDARMWARVATPRHCETVAWRKLDAPPEERPTTVVVRAGGTLRGFVRASDGTPVEGASLWLMRVKDDAWRRVDVRSSRGGGRFELSYPASGRYVVHARGEGPGPSGSSRVEIDLDVDSRTDPIELCIGGGLPLSGVVRDPAGELFRGALVTAHPLGASSADIATVRRVEQGGGVLGASVRTDRDGRFVLPSLSAFDYELVASWGSRSLRFGETRPTSDPIRVRVEHGVDDVELVFAARRVELVITDANGNTPDKPAERFEGPLRVERTRNAARIGIGEPVFAVGELAVAPLQAARDYLVSWTEPGVPYAETTLRIEPDAWCVRREMQLGERTCSTKLTLRIAGPDGEPWTAYATARVHAAASGRLVARSREDGLWRGKPHPVRNATWSVDLPPGEYRVRVDAKPEEGCFGPVERAKVAAADVRVVLAGEPERSVNLKLVRAGFVRFESLSDPAGPTDAEQGLFVDEDLSGRFLTMHDSRLARRPLGGGFARLRSPTVQRFEGFTFEVAGCLDDLDWIVPGWSADCITALPVGMWTLSVVGDSGLLWQDEIAIEEGETTVVRW